MKEVGFRQGTTMDHPLTDAYMMPENSPPKVFMSSLRRMQEQNDQLAALVREQNDLLRERLPSSLESPSSSAETTRCFATRRR